METAGAYDARTPLTSVEFINENENRFQVLWRKRPPDAATLGGPSNMRFRHDHPSAVQFTGAYHNELRRWAEL
jgi:hypothetical protein